MKWFTLAVFLLSSMAYLLEAQMVKWLKEHVSANMNSALRTRRMVGGYITPSHVPWQALVFLSDNMQDGGFGGGALIAHQWVLTTGRNLFVKKSKYFTNQSEPVLPKVYLGITRRAEAGPASEIAVEKVFLHPNFQITEDYENDLALIMLKEPLSFSNTVFPIPLPEKGQDQEKKEGERGIITGWGWGALLTPADFLKFLALPVTTCAETANKFCTRASDFQENICYGDTGGALAFLDPKTDSVYAAGILSYDKSCRNGENAVYMKISAHLPWIQSVMKDPFSSRRASIMRQMYSKFL